MTERFNRAFPLEDIRVRAGGDGRTVEAYAAVFNRSAEIDDYDGHYWELIRAGAFAKTLREAKGRLQVLFNHGRTIHGASSDRYSLPLGTPLWDELREDSRGLLTVTRYAETELADEVLELIRAGAIRAQSFGGRFIRSNAIEPVKPGDLPTIERLEIKLTDYGPAPYPAYKEATIVGVRAEELAATVAHLSPQQRDELRRMLETSDTPQPPAAPVGDTTPAAPPADTPPPAAEAPAQGPSLDTLARLQAQRRRGAA